MPDHGHANFIELLGVARARKTDDPSEKEPVIILSIRPWPDRSWTFHHLGLTWNQAERLRDDLTTLLKTPTTFILIAVLSK